jgi:hypothetical protein
MASTTSWKQVMSPRPTRKRLMSILRMGEGLKVGCKLKKSLFLTQIFIFHWFIFLSQNRGHNKHNLEKIPNKLKSSTVLFATQHWNTYRVTLKLENIFLCFTNYHDLLRMIAMMFGTFFTYTYVRNWDMIQIFWVAWHPTPLWNIDPRDNWHVDRIPLPKFAKVLGVGAITTRTLHISLFLSTNSTIKVGASTLFCNLLWTPQIKGMVGHKAYIK